MSDAEMRGPNAPDAADLGARLQRCVDWAGGKRQLAKLCGVSEAQLYRYLNGESAVPSDKLVAIADACGMDAGWLLTGVGLDRRLPRPTKPPLRLALLTGVAEAFEELLVEYEKPLTPRQRARAMALIYEALRHEESLMGVPFAEVERARLISTLHYLGHESLDDATALLHALLEADAEGRTDQRLRDDPVWTTRLANIASRCSKNWHDSYTGEMYFQRVGTQLMSRSCSRLLDILQRAQRAVGKTQLKWLDLGCGNGRELSFVHRHAGMEEVKGVEISALGCRLAQVLEASSKLPAGAVTQGDFRSLPFEEAHFDVVYSRMSLFCTPYLPGSGSGAEEFFSEAARVLRPGGALALSTPAGEGRVYLPLVQYHSEQGLRALAAMAGLEVAALEQTPAPEGGPSYLQRPCWLGIFRKPA